MDTLDQGFSTSALKVQVTLVGEGQLSWALQEAQQHF